MKKLLLFLTIVTGILAAGANGRTGNTGSCIKKSVLRANSSLMKASSETPEFAVTLKLDFNPAMMRLENFICVFSENNRFYFDDFSRSDTEIRIPVSQGIYDFVVILSDRYKNMTIFNPRNVDVKTDVALELNIADASELISFRPVMPDGEPLTPVFYDEDQETVLDQGNAWDLTTSSYFGTYKYGGFFDLTSYEMRFMYEGEECYIGNRDIHITPDNDLWIKRVYMSFNSNGANLVYLPVTSAETVTLTNHVNDYVILEEDYLESPFERPSSIGDGTVPFDKSRGMAAYFWLTCLNDSFGGSGQWTYNTDFEKHLLSVSQPKDAADNLWPVLFFSEWDELVTKSWPIDPLSMEVKAINTLFNNTYLGNDAGWYPSVSDCVNPYLSFHLAPGLQWGSGVPVTVIRTIDQANADNRKGRYDLTAAYSGNMGEERQVDLEAMKSNVYVNGEEATQQQLNAISKNELPENSIIEWEYVNENITPIEGISPSNRCVVTINTAAKEHQAPTVQALRLHSVDGQPSIRFNHASDGQIMLYAGDFSFHSLSYGEFWYNYEETPRLILEYRPNGTKSFLPLEFKEEPHKFFMPGFGTCFSADFSQIDIESENKWYDLHIKLSDSAGNSQDQVLSPAFRIDTPSNSGIINISESLSERFDLYSTQGLLIRKDITSDHLNGLPSGIYIVSGHKFVIR